MALEQELANALAGQTEIVVDASLCGCALFAESDRRTKAQDFLRLTASLGIRLVAPALFAWEMDTTLRQIKARNRIVAANLEAAWRLVDALPVELIYQQSELEDARSSSRRISESLDQPATYDALYAAIAEARGIHYWTADERFYNRAREIRRQPDGTTQAALPFVRFFMEESL